MALINISKAEKNTPGDREKRTAVGSLRSAMKTVILAAASFLFVANLSAQEHAIDTKHSILTIHVGKTGAFSAFGHEHEGRGAIDRGSAETGAHPSVGVHVNARALNVIDKDESDQARAEVQRTMVGPEVLDSERFRGIVFQSQAPKARWRREMDFAKQRDAAREDQACDRAGDAERQRLLRAGHREADRFRHRAAGESGRKSQG